MTNFSNKNGSEILNVIIDVIIENKAYLSEIDGKIGDGDHGVNMAKGFKMAGQRLTGNESVSDALHILSDVLLTEIGGSMGPLYGTMFMEMAETIEDHDTIDAPLFSKMLQSGLDGVMEIGGAKLGDKSLLDTLIPAIEAFNASIENGASFESSLDALEKAAAIGRDSTIDMISRIGRSSRLGERSRGVIDAGATSCYLILHSLSIQVKRHLSS